MTDWPKPTPFDVISSLDKRRREYRHVGWIYVMRNRAFREQLLSERRGQFFGAYMNKVKQKMAIQVNDEVLRKVVGT